MDIQQRKEEAAKKFAYFKEHIREALYCPEKGIGGMAEHLVESVEALSHDIMNRPMKDDMVITIGVANGIAHGFRKFLEEGDGLTVSQKEAMLEVFLGEINAQFDRLLDSFHATLDVAAKMQMSGALEVVDGHDCDNCEGYDDCEAPYKKETKCKTSVH